MGIPVYMFNGFLESGKTSFIKDTLRDPGFTEGEKTLLVVCEDGEEEYDMDFLKETNCFLLMIESVEDFNGAKLKKAALKVKPDRILIEFNGMWDMKLIETQFPRDWDLYQIVTTINAETYEVYLKNMGPKIIEHVRLSELVVFNRCTPELNAFIRKSNVRAMNPRTLIFLEDNNGNAEDYSDGMPLPYDIEAPVIDIKDEDFGTFYVDAMNAPAKYVDKTVRFKAICHMRPEDIPGRFAAGRFAMTCCADDISYIAFFCDMKGAKSTVTEKGWAIIEAKIAIEYVPEFEGDVPVMKVTGYTPDKGYGENDDDLVYFR